MVRKSSKFLRNLILLPKQITQSKTYHTTVHEDTREISAYV